MDNTLDLKESQGELLWQKVAPLGLSRRKFLALLGSGGVAAVLASFPPSVSRLLAPSMVEPAYASTTATDELIYTSATQLAQAIRAKKVSSEEVVKAYLQRIEAVNPKLNAVVQLAADQALAQAREADAALAKGQIKGALHGVPMTIKDSLDTAGIISTAGSKGRASFVPKEDATVVARVRAAGAIVLGKTNTPEITMAYETDNAVYGRTNNPYDLSRTPGGSCGGAGAIIAAGGSPLDIGSDTGGSVRVPSHFCGIAGIKPNTGRVPRTGHIPPPGGVWGPFTQLGPLARFVEDLVLVLPIIAGIDGQDPEIIPVPLGDPRKVNLKSLRVAFHTDNGIVSPTTETVEVVKTTAKVLSEAGMAVEEARPQGIEQSNEIFRGFFMDGGAESDRLLQMAGTADTELSDLMRRFLDWQRANPMTVGQFSNLLARWSSFRAAMLSFMAKYDVIVCPACAHPAKPHRESLANTAVYSYTKTYNLTGWPAVVVRGGTSPEGLPIGVQVVACPWREDVALAVAQHIETALGGWRPPSL